MWWKISESEKKSENKFKSKAILNFRIKYPNFLHLFVQSETQDTMDINEGALLRSWKQVDQGSRGDASPLKGAIGGQSVEDPHVSEERSVRPKIPQRVENDGSENNEKDFANEVPDWTREDEDELSKITEMIKVAKTNLPISQVDSENNVENTELQVSSSPAQVETALSAHPSPPHPIKVGDRLKPLIYDGSSSWPDYLVQFNMIAKLNGWNEQEKVLYLGDAWMA